MSPIVKQIITVKWTALMHCILGWNGFKVRLFLKHLSPIRLERGFFSLVLAMTSHEESYFER